MDSVKNVLKEAIKSKAAEVRSIRAQVRELAWVSATACTQYCTLRREAGRDPSKVATAKAAFKQGRRPETGQERYDLHQEARGVGSAARYLLLAYAWYRGRLYATVEHNTQHEADPWTIAATLHGYLPSDRALDCTADNAKRWLQGEAIAPAPRTTAKAA